MIRRSIIVVLLLLARSARADEEQEQKQQEQPKQEEQMPIVAPPDPPPSPPKDEERAREERRLFVGPGLRLSPGTTFGLTNATPIAFTFDAAATARIGHKAVGARKQWVLVPEAGWSWNGAGGRQFLTAGVGVGYGHGESRPPREARSIFGGISYVPRFVLGIGESFPVKGFRHGLLWDHGETTFSLEVAHELLWFDDGSRRVHALRLSASFDLGRLLWLLLS